MWKFWYDLGIVSDQHSAGFAFSFYLEHFSATGTTSFTTYSLQIDVSLITKRQFKYSFIRWLKPKPIASIVTSVCKQYVVKLLVALAFFHNSIVSIIGEGNLNLGCPLGKLTELQGFWRCHISRIWSSLLNFTESTHKC